MLKIRFCLVSLLLLALFSPLFSDVKQVRVTVQRALVYAEPNRTSARLEIVEKGAVLTLFQQTKVKQVWYYVTFNSSRYGSRISGFIHESAVESVTEGTTETAAKPPVEQPPPQPVKVKEEKKEPEKPPTKTETVAKPPVEQPPPQPAKVKEEKKEPEKPPAKTETVAKPPVKQPPPQPVKVKEEKKEPAPPRRVPVTPQRGERGLLTFGLGYGSSFGGAGGLVQLNFKAGLALHAGGGLYPTTLIYSETDWVKNEALYSLGLKYYFPVRSSTVSPYIDLQYGGLKVEAAQVVIGIWEYAYVYSREQKTLWGPSVLAGAEMRLGRIAVNAALGVSYSLTDWEFLEQKLFLAFDVGLLIHF
jgi:outer membrane biosynthesis protein TonB